ncbi:hypothetical protein [Chryseobacterium gallinarum]|uniref:hypothetical protein n=1 Tax=Chryseobacterium gallinarum TaxID=1324352 RepID=UPI001E5D1EAD|nr:hypothetical protein [Chryseobacterium gallinarum]
MSTSIAVAALSGKSEKESNRNIIQDKIPNPIRVNPSIFLPPNFPLVIVMKYNYSLQSN